VLVVRKGHPLVKSKLTREQFAALRHVDIELAFGRGGVGQALAEQAFAEQGLRRNVALRVPTFSAAALVLASTDLVAGLPRRLVASLVPALPLAIVDAPGPALRFQTHLLWHERAERDAVARLFRELVRETLREPRAGARPRTGPRGSGS